MPADSLALDLSGRNAVITGASSGLGQHVALTYAKQGATVALLARRVGELEKTKAEIEALGGKAYAIHLDVSDPLSVDAAIADTVKALGQIDILVNSSGIARPKPFLETTVEDWDQTLGVNLRGTWLVSKAVAAHMAQHGKGGSIINIASLTALRVVPQLTAYAVSKAGVVQLTKYMAVELARYGIRTNTICPGYFISDINREHLESPAGQVLIKRNPQRRLTELEDMSGILLLLASDAGKHMNGTVTPIDGGHSEAPL